MRQEIEIRNATMRAKAFMGGGSRRVMVSRAVVGGFLLAVCISLWIARALAMVH